MTNLFFFICIGLALMIILLILYCYRPSQTPDYENQQLNQQLLTQQLAYSKRCNPQLVNESAYRFLQEQKTFTTSQNLSFYHRNRAILLGIIIFLLVLTYYATTQRWQAVLHHQAQPVVTSTPQKQNEDMILTIQRKLRENPNQGENWYELGLAYTQNNEFDHALEAYSRAVIILGRQPQILGAAATALYYQNNQTITEQAQQWLDEALKKDPEDTTSLLLLANYAFQQENYSQAIKLWQQILDSQRKVDRKLLIRMMDIAEEKIRVQ